MLTALVFVLFVSAGLCVLGQKSNNYNVWAIVLLFLIILNVIFAHFSIHIPLGLLLGPILFRLQRLAVNKRIGTATWLFHLLPFIGLAILDVSSPVYLASIACSLIIYSCFIWKLDQNTEYHLAKQQTIFQLSLINCGVATLVIIWLLVLFQIIDSDEVETDIPILSLGLHGLAVFIISVYLLNNRHVKDGRLEDVNLSASYNFSHEMLRVYALKLEVKLEVEKIHLRSSLSLADLSEELDIPKHHLSQVFNLHYNKPYYQYIAERRIEEAVIRLQSDQNTTLESLAYDCGFNSKTTFNKYFKDIIGETPSDYRARIKH